MEDVSRLNEVIVFNDGGNFFPLRITKMEFDYQAPIDNFSCYPQPDVFTGSGFIFTDREKLNFIRKNGLCVSVHFPEWDSTQNKRFWIITLIITIIATYLLKRIWSDWLFDKVEKNNKLIKIGTYATIAVVVSLLIILGISTNSKHTDPQKATIQYFNGKMQSKPITCPECDGKGEIKCIWCQGNNDNCHWCKGKGVIKCRRCFGKKKIYKERYW